MILQLLRKEIYLSFLLSILLFVSIDILSYNHIILGQEDSKDDNKKEEEGGGGREEEEEAEDFEDITIKELFNDDNEDNIKEEGKEKEEEEEEEEDVPFRLPFRAVPFP